MVHSLILVLTIFQLIGLVFSQTNLLINTNDTKKLEYLFTNTTTSTGLKTNTLEPIRGWNNILFGMEYQSVKSNFVFANPNLRFIEPDFPEFDDTINYYYLTTYKDTFYQKIDFNFNSKKELYLIRLNMNPRFFSFLKLYKALYLKYGPPFKNQFKRITWQDNVNTITLTRESTITYYGGGYITNQIQNNSILDPQENIDKIIKRF